MKRRKFLTGIGTYAIMGAALRPVMAQSVRAFGVEPDTQRDQSAAFQIMVDHAAASRETINLPAGRYLISNIKLPSNAHIVGDGAILVSSGAHPLFVAQNANSISLSGVTIDANGRGPAVETIGLLDFRQVDDFHLTDVTLIGARNDIIYTEQVTGSIRQCDISNAGRFAVFAVESRGLSILNNQIFNCADGGIIVHRWQNGPDGTMVANNKITHIGASRGGTGQWGESDAYGPWYRLSS